MGISRLIALLVIAIVARASWASTLYVSDSDRKQLYTLSISNASATLVGNFAFAESTRPIMADLTYDPINDVLYGSSTSLGDDTNLYSINRATGAATKIGPLNTGLMHGLAFDTVSGNLYGAQTSGGHLYKIDKTTGHATIIGAIGSFPNSDDRVGGLTFDPVTHVLYGCISNFADEGGLVAIDSLTGRGTFLVSTRGFTDIAFQPETGILFGIDNGRGLKPDALYTVNPTTGETTLVGQTGLGNNLGLEFVVQEPSTFVLFSFVLGGALARPLLRQRTRP